MRLDLPDGQWAELTEEPNTAQYRAVMGVAQAAGDVPPRAEIVDWAYAIARTMTTAWYVRGPSGEALELADWDKAPARITNRIGKRAQELWRDWSKSADPKDTAEPSSDSSSE